MTAFRQEKCELCEGSLTVDERGVMPSHVCAIEWRTAPFHRQTWQHRHGLDIVAQAAPARARAKWEASTFRVSTGETVMHLGTFDSLQSAQARADSIARRTFNHACGTYSCGEWLPSPRLTSG